MSTKRRLISYALFILGVLLLSVSVLYYFHARQTETGDPVENVPETLSGLPLVQVSIGPEALDSLQQLHGTEFPQEGAAVAVYGNQNAILWVSEAGNASEAVDLTELMRARIAEGNSPFTLLGDFEIDGFTVYALDGMGGAHYFWQAGELVLWLAADVSIAQQAILDGVHFYR